MSNNVALAIVFRLINFGLLIAIASYFTKKYVIVPAYAQIKEKFLVKQNLLENKQSLFKKKEHLIDAIKNQEEYALSLLEKVELWRSTIKQQEKDHQRFYHDQLRETKKRKEAQLRALQLHQMQEELTPQIISGLRKYFTDKFSSEKERMLYNEKVINAMMKESL